MGYHLKNSLYGVTGTYSVSTGGGSWLCPFPNRDPCKCDGELVPWDCLVGRVPGHCGVGFLFKDLLKGARSIERQPSTCELSVLETNQLMHLEPAYQGPVSSRKTWLRLWPNALCSAP